MKTINKLAARVVSMALVVGLAACSSSSDQSTMQNETEAETENSAEIIDPGSILSSLQFDTAEKQASYQCLLSAATGTATDEGMQAIPAWWNDDPTSGRGSYQTWCKTSGSSALVDGDLERCARGAVQAMQAPGTRALAVITQHFSATGPVGSINHVSKQIPDMGTTGWSVSLAKTFAGPSALQDSFAINFQRFDGSQLTEESGMLQHPYSYLDNAIGLMEFARTDRSVNDYLADYLASASQFKLTADTYLSDVIVLIEQAIRDKTDLSEEEVTTALERANNEINQAKAFFSLHGDELYQSLLTRETYLDCEGN